MKPRIIGRYALLIIFAAFLWGFFLFDVLSPARDFSEMENRPLAGSPVFSISSLVGNTYTLKYEEYVVDQFAARDSWITLKSLGETALLKTENNGIAYGKDGYLFELSAAASPRQLDKNIGYIQDFARSYRDVPVTLGIIPSSFAVYPEKLPAEAPVADQEALAAYCRESLSGEPLDVLDLTPVLSARKDEYIYYRTDHHWTTLGAFYAYESLMGLMNRPAAGIDSFAAHDVPDFYGTHYSKAKNWDAVPDTITWYDVPVSEVIIDGEPADGLHDLAMFEKRDKYAAFLHGNNGLTVIRSESGGASGKILLIKDSYGNSLAPFLAADFREVHVVDLRYFGDMTKLMAQNDYDMVFILYSVSALTQDLNIYKLGQ